MFSDIGIIINKPSPTGWAATFMCLFAFEQIQSWQLGIMGCILEHQLVASLLWVADGSRKKMFHFHKFIRDPSVGVWKKPENIHNEVIKSDNFHFTL